MTFRKYLVILLAVACIAVFTAGCTSSKPATTTLTATAAAPAAPDVSSKNPGDFGNVFDVSPGNVKALDCFTNTYPPALKEKGTEHRFIDALITTGLDKNNLPVNDVTAFPANQDPIYFFIIYDNFNKGDDVTISWLYSPDHSKDLPKVVKQTGDDYGRFIITFKKPDGGWSPGTHMIQVTDANWKQKTIVFTVGGDKVVTQPLTCSDGTTGSASNAPASKGTSCRPSCTLGTKCNDEQDCASGFCVQGVCSQGTSQTAVVATAAPVVQTTVCPANIWGGTWDTRWNSYSNENDIVDMVSGTDDWNSYPASAVTLTQNCWDVTGTIHFREGSSPECIGTFTTTIDRNNPDQLKGEWTTAGCEAEGGEGYTGKFSWTMAKDNKAWIGKMISANNDYKDDPQWQDNWAGRRV